RKLGMSRVKACHVTWRITRPRLTADILIESTVTIGQDVQAGNFLIAQINGQGVRVLLAEFVTPHRFHERSGSEILRVPARTRKRADHSCRQDLSFGCYYHF